MSDQVESETAESPLTTIVREEKDPDLFPPEVVALYERGKARKARQALLKAAKKEFDPERKQKMRDYAK